MRFQTYAIAVLISLIAWTGSVEVARDAYRGAQSAGYIKNLHIREHIQSLL